MKRPAPSRSIDAEAFLKARPVANQRATVDDKPGGGALVHVPLNRPRWLVPPMSWLIPFSQERRIELDPVGKSVLTMCNGRRNVETIIEEFAQANKLSFREAQLPVTKFLKQMTERGIVAIVGQERTRPAIGRAFAERY
jgi:hypothetical protein